MQEFRVELCDNEADARREADLALQWSTGRKIFETIKFLFSQFLWRRRYWLLLLGVFYLFGFFRQLTLWRVVGLGSLWFGVKLCIWRWRTIRTWPTNQFTSAPNIRDDPSYQDPELLRSMWKLPVAQKFEKVGGLLYQPKEGWCGYATVNSALLSVGAPLLKYELLPRHVSLSEMTRLLTLVKQQMATSAGRSKQFEDFQVFSAEHIELAQLKEHLRASNDENYRYLLLFHRAPLFFNDAENPKGIQQMFAAHWSPILGFNEEKDLVLVGDVNEKYKSWITSSQRILDSIKNRSFVDGGEWRGLIRLQLKKSVSSVSNSSILDESLFEAFSNAKSHYYSIATKASNGFIVETKQGFNQLFSHNGTLPLFRLFSIKDRLDDDKSLFKAIKQVPKLSIVSVSPMIGEVARQNVLKTAKNFGFAPVTSRGVGKKSTLTFDLQSISAKNCLLKADLEKDYVIVELGVDPAYDRKHDMWNQLSVVTIEAFNSMFSMLGAKDAKPKWSKELAQCIHANTDPTRKELRAFVVVTKDSNTVVGSVLATCAPASTVGSFFLLAVDPKHGGKGFGKTLSYCAMNAVKELGAKHCVIEASPQGRPLYDKMGFRALAAGDMLLCASRANDIGLGLRALAKVLETYLIFNGPTVGPVVRTLLFVCFWLLFG